MGLLPRFARLAFLLALIVCLPILTCGQERRVPEALRAIPVPRPFSLGGLTAAERLTPTRPEPAIGVRRSVPGNPFDRPLASITADGRPVFSASLTSPGAARIRVHFRDFDAGSGEVWLYAPGDTAAAGPYTGRGTFGTGEFWSGGVDSDTVVLAYIASPGAGPARLPFTIDAISHQWAGPNAAAALCNLDVSCYSQYRTLATAVAQLEFVGDPPDTRAFVCTGSMIDTRGGSRIPYMLTAHHCISSETEANSIQAHFLYQTSSCNAKPDPVLSAAPSVLGGSYLAGADLTAGDYSLVLLAQDAPDGVGFLKWSTSLDSSAEVTGIHHPAGSYKRISFGNRTADRTTNISGQIGPRDMYYQVAWTQGVTEGGSSGSPLLDRDGNLVGTLTAGPSDDSNICALKPPTAIYGRFSSAYDSFSPYLEDVSSVIAATPSSLSFRMTDGVPAQVRQTVAIATTSAVPVAFTAATNRPWLSVTAGGTASLSAPGELTVSIDPSLLTTPGTLNGLVTIRPGSSGALSLLVTATVALTRSNVALSVSPNPVYQSAGAKRWEYSIGVYETAGAAVKLTALKINSTDYTSQIPGWFGSDSLPGLGSTSVSLYSTTINPPATRLFELDGTDVATGRTWQVTQTVQFLGPWAGPVMQLNAAPSSVYQNPDPAAPCQWMQNFILRETAGYPAQLTGFKIGPSDFSSELARDFGTVRLPANGSLLASVCRKTQPVLPAVPMIEIDGTDDSGTAVSVTTFSDVSWRPTSPPKLAATPPRIALSPGAPSSQFAVDLGGATVAWAADVVSQYDTGWLTVSPTSGIGGGQIAVTANPDGLGDGYYSAIILVHAKDAFPQAVPLTVSLQVGPVGPAPSIFAGGIVNAWWPTGGMAPGSLISIWGTNLATGPAVTPSVPFANRLAGTTVTIDGILAPLFYVSSRQLNVQVPFEITPGTAQVTVTVNGQSDTRQMQVTGVAPGICSDAAGKLCYDPSGKPGDYKLIFVTGQGAISPKVPTGAAPFPSTPIAQLPHLRPEDVKVTVGGVAASVWFAGIPSWSVGVLQINFQVPAGAPLGDQPLVVTLFGQPSQTAVFTVTQ